VTQATLPWIERPADAGLRLRRRAIVGLLGIGAAHAVLAVVMYGLLDRQSPEPRTLLFTFGSVLPMLGGLGLVLRSLTGQHPVQAVLGTALLGAGATVGGLLQLTPVDPYVLGIALLVIVPGVVGVKCLAGGVAVILWRQIAWFLNLRFTPLMIFIGGVLGIIGIAWLHAYLFRLVDSLIADSAINTEAVAFLGGELTTAELSAAFSERLRFMAYVLWPLQFAIVRDLIAMGGIIGFISLVPLYGIWWERKVAARMQSRLGPMRVGGWHGWAQSLADGLKLICKEDFVPPEGDKPLFRLAPYLAFVPAVAAFIALPFAGAYVFRDLDVALIFILAMLGIEVVGVIIAGWASNNKWSVYGAMREACQMVSYEIPLGMSLLIPVMTVGALRLTAIADAQQGGFADWLAWRNPWCFIAFFAYYVAALASCKRAPFDLPESESELVAGFHTEYSGFRWSLFFFAEYAAMFAVSGLAAILFLGAWYGPLPAAWAPTGDGALPTVVRGLLFDGPILFVLKAALLFYLQLWIRWTLPRVRIDQVLYACVQVLLPLTMVVLLANTVWLLFDNEGHPRFLAFARGVQMVLATIGLLLLVVIASLILYGYRNRRRLVGTLAIEHLRGA
jgi:NADH-quinone oxidoreductase subunit H